MILTKVQIIIIITLLGKWIFWNVSMISENVCWVWNVRKIDEEGISWCGDISYYSVIYHEVLCNTSVKLEYVLCWITIMICINCLCCVNVILRIRYCNLWCMCVRYILNILCEDLFLRTIYMITHKTEYMCYNQTGDISTLDGTPLKLVEKFTYLGSSVASTEKDIDTRLTKA